MNVSDQDKSEWVEEHAQNVPLGQPPLRVWEINANSTRYDRLVAAPSDETLRVMWILWATIFGAIAIYVGVIFFAILVNRRTRKSPFNCYLLFLMVPDLLYTSSCSLSCILNVASGHYHSAAACRWQAFYIIWGVGANGWLNAVIAWEIRKMLRASYIRKHYFPPTRKRVAINSILVYLYAAFLSVLPLLGQDWIPHTVQAQTGLVCVPLEDDLASTLFFWLFFTPFFMGAPLCIVAYVVWDVLYHKLLPPAGKRRVIGLYFFRIAVVFVVMWMPTIFVFYVLNGVDPWSVWASSVWGHMQGFVSATVSLLKPDIAGAVRDFVQCRVCRYNPQGSTDEMIVSDKSSSSLQRSFSRMFRGQRQMASSMSSNGEFSLEPSSLGTDALPNMSSRETETEREDEEYEDVPKQCEVTYRFLDEISDIDTSGDLEEQQLSDVPEEEHENDNHSDSDKEPTEPTDPATDSPSSDSGKDNEQPECSPVR